MDYSHYNIEDFIADPFFRDWVKNPDEDKNKFWEDWLKAHPDKKETLEKAREFVLLMNFRVEGPAPEETEEVKHRIEHRLRPLRANKTPGKFRFYRIAAVLAFLLLGSVLSLWLIPGNTVKVSTAFAETRQYVLPDGSEVMLNANSEIHYEKQWESGKPREVWLEGEAFFDVKKDSSPFYVHTGTCNIEVLGTSFDVYNRSGKTTVALERGKVRLNYDSGSGKEAVLMNPGEVVSFEDNTYKREEKPTEQITAWKHNRMYFENTPLSEIADMLQHHYGFRPVFNDPGLKQKRFTGSYAADRVEVLLEAIREAFNIQVEIESGKKLIFSNKKDSKISRI